MINDKRLPYKDSLLSFIISWSHDLKISKPHNLKISKTHNLKTS